MFTGLVQELGTVVRVERARSVDRLTVHAPKTADHLETGESVAVNGVCLSVVRRRPSELVFEAIPETRRLTSLKTVTAGSRVNLERSLTLSDRLNGHVVFGHVDGVGRIVRRRHQAGDVVLEIRVDRSLRRFIVPKGPVAVDGVSLTVGTKLTPTAFQVFLIPETIRKTTLGLRKVGDLVNIELDYFAKLVTQVVSSRLDDRRRRQTKRET
ncbi:MAG TPA: riboflavin synthase [Candidatus Omnitrophica bacterium]|nr:MAG: riboflavin synthase subunit alpha [Omnitrophica WOR_2 bacterium GWA2_63_20]OGX17264.1 MAG: riboflavin synthase subunit alpha [Omnitrophica WOR_2 bacterium GWF2_63_9]OGX31317.1 MAG: riboflavin synthase subunit alpha [Omnitrophica WOR_2 bacterium RIFCSPHIGHO2_12_FULL_64_13]OGX36965.1 MAG: riboflavin synthase subunit alpha [Omnitrophica WOR_2 bacterium RIFCSPHIGHO2_02_FULL_63_39]OGX46428.1 MAG: riboflavin synthase subunit alpha [Omnitrophica WOR_2 bacterium RIFCSPLOWO2_02_FULL_63_16]OGX49